MDIIKKAELSQQKEIEMLKQEKQVVNSPENKFDNSITKSIWPSTIKEDAFYGLTGKIIRAIEPNSEADVVALLANFLTAFGNIVGNKPHFKVEGDEHPLRLFCALVGETSKARKGTSWGHIKNLFREIDNNWAISGGLSSGEGLIWVVRDRIEKEDDTTDDGVQDKRLLLVEAEFASILKVLGREGNTLSPNIRNAWDSGNLNTLTKNSPAKATGAHISILGHITKDELLRYLSDTEKANGFGNRFLWFCVKRSKPLPFGGQLNTGNFDLLKDKLKDVISFSSSVGEIQWAEETRPLWEHIYQPLSEGKTGLLGSMIARAEAYVVRLSCTYALLDKSVLIRPEHLKAALAVWDYAESSARYIFQDMTGSELSDEIIAMLACSPNGLTKTDVNNQFGRHRSSLELTEALNTLQGLGLVEHIIKSTEGRSKEVWYLLSKSSNLNSHNSLNSQVGKSYLGKLESFLRTRNGSTPPISNL